METEYLSQQDWPKWNQFVAESPQGSVFSTTAYLQAIGRPFELLVVHKHGRILGGVALTKNEIGTHANPILVKHLGFLTVALEGGSFRKISEEKRIVDALIEATSWCRSFDYRFHPSFTNWMPLYWAGYRQETLYTYQLRHPDDRDRILADMNPKLRHVIRKARDGGLEITRDIGTEEFYAVCGKTFAKHGAKPPYKLDTVRRLRERLEPAGAMTFLAVRDANGQCHAACAMVHDPRTSFFVLNGSDPAVTSQGGNALLVLGAIEEAATMSAVFDFEGSMIKPIEKFYRGFGGELVPYFHIWRPGLINGAKNLAVKAYKKIRRYDR